MRSSFKSIFFNELKNNNNEWGSDPNHSLSMKIDDISDKIEKSGNINKQLFNLKCEEMFTSHENNQNESFLNKEDSDEYFYEHFDEHDADKRKCKLHYAYENCYRALFSEIKAYDTLIQNGFKGVFFVEEKNSKKSPDFQMDGGFFCEVKNINPPVKEEDARESQLAWPRETDDSYIVRVIGKIEGAIKGSVEKFFAVNCLEDSKRMIFLSVVVGDRARDAGKGGGDIFNEKVKSEMEKKYKVSITLMDPFS